MFTVHRLLGCRSRLTTLSLQRHDSESCGDTDAEMSRTLELFVVKRACVFVCVFCFGWFFFQIKTHHVPNDITDRKDAHVERVSVLELKYRG